MKYSKLVRDKIPELIKSKGEAMIMHTAGETEYWQKLKEKLKEECEEFVKDETQGEIADILEVIEAICAYKKFTPEEVSAIKAKKKEERGGFEGRIILDEA